MQRVLVVDGYEESRVATARELDRAGFEVVAVEEEDDAVRAFGEAPPDVVLLDLPLAEAEEAAGALRPLAATRNTHPVAIVAIVDPTIPRRVREQARANGIDYFFLRPCPPPEIVKHLRRMHR
jgi:CheY-like chemotaxis protein